MDLQDKLEILGRNLLGTSSSPISDLLCNFILQFSSQQTEETPQ